MTSKIKDIDIRKQLKKKLEVDFREDPSTVIIDELGICQGKVRTDLAVVNGKFYAYEIKSPSDTLARLPKQSELYSKVFDYVTLVVHEGFCKRATDIIPEWWGIIIAKKNNNGSIELNELRSPGFNNNIKAYDLVKLLWKEDALELLSQKDCLKGFKNKPRRFAWLKVCELYDIDEIRETIRMKLKERAMQKVVGRLT
jgi:hypothetical protein